jgi:formate dehydrogenase
MNGCQSLQKEIESNYSGDENIKIVRAPCMGRCHQAPVVEVGKKHITNANLENIKT